MGPQPAAGGGQGLGGAAADGEQRQEQVHQRPDREDEHHRADREVAAEQPAHEDDGGLDRRAHQADRLPGRAHQPGHQPVARPGSQARADVGGGGHAVDQDAGHEQRDPRRQRHRRRQPPQEHVERQTDDQDVAHRAQPRALPQRDPQQQHQRPHDHRPLPDAQAEVAGQALVQDVPGHDAEVGPHDERLAEGEGDQADVQLGQASWQSSVGEGAHPRNLATRRDNGGQRLRTRTLRSSGALTAGGGHPQEERSTRALASRCRWSAPASPPRRATSRLTASRPSSRVG